MQLGRSYSRRLKSVKNEIYELFPSARHAYSTIRPAVKTSRPHFFQRSFGGFPLLLQRDRAFGVTRLPAEAS